jgi:hypothetical protein
VIISIRDLFVKYGRFFLGRLRSRKIRYEDQSEKKKVRRGRTNLIKTGN